MKEFSKILKEGKIQQLFSYPRCPKINEYIERYSRTLRKEFINNIWSVIFVPS
jgi:transposase InsO family protein